MQAWQAPKPAPKLMDLFMGAPDEAVTLSQVPLAHWNKPLQDSSRPYVPPLVSPAACWPASRHQLGRDCIVGLPTPPLLSTPHAASEAQAVCPQQHKADAAPVVCHQICQPFLLAQFM